MVTRSATIVDDALAIEIADLGSGEQLTSIRANGRKWHFDERDQWKVQLYDGTDTLGELTPSYFTTSLVEYPTPTTFRVTYSKGGETTSVILNGTYNFADGSVRVVPTVTLDPGEFDEAGWSFQWIQAVKPYEEGTKSRMVAYLPAFGGMVYPDATTVRVAVPRCDYPGFLGAVHPQASGNVTAGHQCVAIFHTSSRSCLAIRTTCTDGRGIRYEVNGDGSNVVVVITMFPENHLATQSFTLPYGIELRPMPGDWHDANEWYGERNEAEDSPFVARGPMSAMNGAAGHCSVRWLNGDMFIWMCPGNAGDPTTHDPALWSRCVDEIDAIVEYFGTDLRYVVEWGTWAANGLDNWPDVFPPIAGFLTVLPQVVAISPNISNIVYTFPLPWDPDSTFYAGTASAVSLVHLKPDQSPLEMTEAVDSAHYLVQFGNATARTVLQDHWKQITAEIDGLDGWYVDTISGNNLPGDERDGLADSDKGPGATLFEMGKAAWMAAMRTEFKVTQGKTDWITIGEWGAETQIPYMDSQGHEVSLLVTPTPTFDIFVPGYRVAYSRFVGSMHFGQLLSAFDAPIIDDWDIIMWKLERQFHYGSRMGLAWFGFTDLVHLIPQPTDDDYATIGLPYQAPAVAFMRNMVRSLAAKNVKQYFRGRRLRPLPDSPERRLIERGHEFHAGAVVPGGVTGAIADGADVQSSVWHSEELAEEPVGLVLTNHHHEFRLQRLKVTVEEFPRIAGKTRLVRNRGDSTREEIARLRGSIDITVEVPAFGVEVYELLPS